MVLPNHGAARSRTAAGHGCRIVMVALGSCDDGAEQSARSIDARPQVVEIVGRVGRRRSRSGIDLALAFEKCRHELVEPAVRISELHRELEEED